MTGDDFEPAREPLRAIRDLIAERSDALGLAAGALQCVAKLLPDGERHIINFTGEWQRFGTLSIADILDRANTALEGTPARRDGEPMTAALAEDLSRRAT